MRYVHITAHDLLAKSTYYTSTHFTAHRGLSRRARAAARPLPGRSVGRTDSVRYHPEARSWVGRSVDPTQFLLRRAARGGSVGRGGRVGNALARKSGSVGQDAERKINFAPPSRA